MFAILNERLGFNKDLSLARVIAYNSTDGYHDFDKQTILMLIIVFFISFILFFLLILIFNCFINCRN